MIFRLSFPRNKISKITIESTLVIFQIPSCELGKLIPHNLFFFITSIYVKLFWLWQAVTKEDNLIFPSAEIINSPSAYITPGDRCSKPWTMLSRFSLLTQKLRESIWWSFILGMRLVQPHFLSIYSRSWMILTNFFFIS